MSEQYDATNTPEVKHFLTEKYGHDAIVHEVGGGYSRNRRAIIEVGDTFLFAKEVDVSLLPDDGEKELAWLKKDYDLTQALKDAGITVVPEWAELHMDGHLLLLPSYRKEDGWRWSLPEDVSKQVAYVQAIVDAVTQLESAQLPRELTESLSLQPFFRDEIAQYDGIDPILNDDALRQQLIQRFTALSAQKEHLQPAFAELVAALNDDDQLHELKRVTQSLAEQSNDHFGHCDVRSDNIAYNEHTGDVKFVDWNWASYTPAKFGATEFLIDMMRHGVDVTPWHDDMNPEFLAGIVGYMMIRSLKEPLTPGSKLRDMQAESAAIAYHLYLKLVA